MSASTNAVNLNVVWDDGDHEGSGSVEATSVAEHWTSLTRKNAVIYLLLPMLCLAAATVCIRYLNLDLVASRLFFDVEAGSFSNADANPWVFLYTYGPLPGMAIGIGAIAMVVASFWWQRFRLYREPCVFLALMLALGPGLLVNGVLKPSWDRPRPCELTEFGGSEEFLPVLNLHFSGETISKSFPSGHASIGFYLLAPIFVLSNRSRRWSMLFLMLGLSLGFAMGLGRVVQGKHFPSDVLWSGAIVYFTGLILAYVIRPATRFVAAPDSTTDPHVFRLDEYRSATDLEPEEAQTPDQAASKRRAA